MSRLGRSLRQRRGATATETLILIILVALVILASVKVLRDSLANKAETANEHVSAVSIDREDPDEKRRRQKAKMASRGGGEAAGSQAEASQQARTPGAGEGSPNAASTEEGGDPIGEAPAESGAAPPQGGCGGFNPFIIPIVLGLLGLLGYVVMKTKKG